MQYGACYYPEHWPEDRWPLDLLWMKEAHFNIIRIGEFAWSKLEVSEGVYDFDWLDRFLNLCIAHDIKVILGTPSATPPKWLMDKHPDIYMVDYEGKVKGFGNRRHYCYNNEVYKSYVANIVEKLVTRYHQHESIVAWQIDNEFGCNDTTRCYCERCRVAFQRWLEKKYRTIDELNKTWGTVFWSQVYNDFSQVIVPGYAVYTLHNPSLVLDYRRFASDAVVEFQRQQVETIRKYNKHHVITHNYMGAFNEIDYDKLALDLDIISWDNYPNLHFKEAADFTFAAMQHDMTRCFKQQSFWVMEHQSGQPGGDIMFETPKPGELRRWVYQSIAHGASGILFFRWRTAIFGAEQYWHGILNHDGKLGRKYDEAKLLGQELKALTPILESLHWKAEVAIVRSFDIEWIFEIQPQMLNYRYIEHAAKYYKSLFERHVEIDVISPEADFSHYKLLILPNFIISTPQWKKKIEHYVAQGGVVIMDYRAGAKDWNNNMSVLTLPGEYSELLGIEVHEYGILPHHVQQGIQFSEQKDQKESYSVHKWYEVVEPTSAVTFAQYEQDYYAGKPAITEQRYGEGYSYYIASELDEAGMSVFIDEVFDKHFTESVTECNSLIKVPKGVEIVRRYSTYLNSDVYFVINHLHEDVSIELQCEFYNQMNDQTYSGCYELSADQVLLLTVHGEVV